MQDRIATHCRLFGVLGVGLVLGTTAHAHAVVCNNFGAAYTCDDGNPCTDDACDPPSGCDFDAPSANGTACDDGNACTGPGQCGEGVCLLGVPIAGSLTPLPELCDGLDNDCDGLTDETWPAKGQDCDGPDADTCPNGTWTCSGNGSGIDCKNDGQDKEICDGKDNDCNGTVDDGLIGIGLPCEGADADLCVDGVTWCDGVADAIACDEVGTALWLKLDEPSGSLAGADSSRHARSLTAGGGAAFGAAGIHGAALQLSTAGRLSDVPNGFKALNGLNGATWAAWVKHDGPFSSGFSETVVAQWGSGGALPRHFALRIKQNGVELALRTTGDVAATPAAYRCLPGVDGCTSLVPTGVWTHVAAVFVNKEVRLYVNGVLAKVRPAVGAAIAVRDPSDVLSVGADNALFANGFHGAIDDVVIVPRALNELELEGLAANGPTADAPELCNGLDDDCDTQVDEGWTTGVACDGGDIDLCAAGKTVCGGAGTATLCDESDATAYWPADEASGARIADHSGAGRDLTMYGTATLTPSGKLAGAVDLSAAGKAYGDAGSVDVLGGKSAATWMAWLKPATVAPGTAPVVSTYQTALAGKDRTWAFGRQGDGFFLRLRVSSDAKDVPTTVLCDASTGCGTVLSVGQWTHVAVTFDLGAAKFYVNGALARTASFNPAAIALKHPSERLILGSDTLGELGYFDGALDDVRLYAKALAPADVLRAYQNTLGTGLDLCNGLDDDCDGQTDEEHPQKGAPCDGADSDACANGTWTCKPDASGVQCTNETVTAISELCNGLDDDCDGATDESFSTLGAACDAADADGCAEGVFACASDGKGVTCVRDGPAAWWRMSAGSGDVALDTAQVGSTRHFGLSGATWTTGDFGGALAFDGLGAHATATVGLSGPMTLELRVRPTSPGYIYGEGTLSASGFNGYWSGATLTHTIDDGGTLRTLSAPLSAGAWHHVAVAMAPGGASLTVDGVPAATSVLLGSATVGTLTLGELTGSPETFAGAIDEVAIFPYVEPAADIAAHAATGLPAIDQNRELCDGSDNDCDGETDEGLTGAPGGLCDGADLDYCAHGTWTCAPNALDVECTNEAVQDIEELCNDLDDDCDALVDEGFLWEGLAVSETCDAPGECGIGFVECRTDTTAGCSTGPGGSASEVVSEACNQKDDDCDGATDEGPSGAELTRSCYTGPAGTEAVGACKAGSQKCLAGSWAACESDVLPQPSDATCDGIDQDCNGATDDGYSDAYACTVDACVGGIPTSVPDHSKCDDGNPCSSNSCTAKSTLKGGCTFVADDTIALDQATWGKACQKAVCKGGKIDLVVDDSSSGDDGLDCTADLCQGGVPLHPLLPGWCLIAGKCLQTGEVNVADGCKVCAPQFDQSAWSENVAYGDFDKGGGDQDGYVAEELVNGGITWGVSPGRSVTGLRSLYFGSGATLTYETGARVAARATSAAFSVPDGIKAELTFQVFMDTEGYTGSEKFDTLTVSIVEEGTGLGTELWDSMHAFGSRTDGVFKKVLIDVSAYAGQTVRVAFEFDSGDAYFNNYEGVYLDKVRVETACCLSGLDCDDQMECTKDLCTTKRCSHELFPACSDCVRRQVSAVVLADRGLSTITPVATGETRWSESLAGYGSVLAAYDQRANVGLALYPAGDPDAPCDVAGGLDVDFHSSAEVVSNFLPAASPVGQRPVAAALAAVRATYANPAVMAESGAKYVVLVTDGPDSCGGDVLAEIQALRAVGIKTIVVAWDDVASVPTLTEWALAGGLARPLEGAQARAYLSATDLGFAAALDQAMGLAVAEICDGLDDDCTGTKDDAVPSIACNLECNGGLGGKQVCSDGKLSACTEQKKAEVCDAKDNDCDGATDEDWPDLGIPCAVGEGACFSTGKFVCPPLGSGLTICEAPPKSGVPEICNGKDDDCNGEPDDGVHQSCTTPCGTGSQTCQGGVFGVCTAIAPAPETCNNLDDDCNGLIDDVVPVACTGKCGAGFKSCAAGVFGACSTDPKPETCNATDDDCDGQTDEGGFGLPLKQACVVDTPLKGECTKGTATCSGGAWTACVPSTFPGAEVCDGKDNDCNGVVDDGVAGEPVFSSCYDGPDGTKNKGICKAGVRWCMPEGGLGDCEGQVTPSVEICDGKDNDCDGAADDEPGIICLSEPGCGGGFCLCGNVGGAGYHCYLN